MRLSKIIVSALAISIAISSCTQNGVVPSSKLESTEDSVSYYIGIFTSKNFTNSNIEEDVNLAAFLKGFQDGLDKKEQDMTEQEMGMFLQTFFRELQETKNRENLLEGRTWLAANAEKEGVITTESGLQYKVIQEGQGENPLVTDTVVAHYRGTLIDGTEFDSSFKNGEPAEFALNRVITGWKEGMQLMKPGAKYMFYIPTELAYGLRPHRGGKVEPNMALIFEVELIDVKKGPKNN